jgi:competence ComEA-like helix-hairpin-helix protein
VRIRSKVLVVLAACLAGLPANGAWAQGEQLGFGVKPIGPDATRGYFFFRDAKPGQTLRGEVIVGNSTSRSTEVLVKAQDAKTAGDGGIEFVDLNDGPGTWVSPQRKLFTLGPHKSTRLDLTVKVPEGTEAGDHFGGIVLYDANDVRELQEENKGDDAVALKYISRIGIPIRTRIDGNLRAQVELQNVKVDVTPSSSGIVVTFANSGNVLVPESHGRAVVNQGDIELSRRKIDLTSFLPGTTIDVRLPFKGDPVETTYRVQGVLRPMFADVLEFDENVTFGDRETEELKDESGRAPVVPEGGSGFPIWAVILIVLLLLGILAALLRRRRDDGAAPAPAVAPPPATAPAAPPAPGRLSLSTASVDELASIPGIGPNAARRIVEHRDEYGRFTSLDDLLQIENFDRERVDRIAQHAYP